MKEQESHDPYSGRKAGTKNRLSEGLDVGFSR